MTARLSMLCFMLLAAVSLAAEKVEDFEYGARPPQSVFDPDGLLDSATLKTISDPLAKIHEEEGVDVVVVVIKDLEGAPPEHVAGRFAAAWCTAPIHAVVLHVPGRADSPWIIPGGELLNYLKPETVAQKLADAKRNASREPTEPGKVRAAANEAADMLRYWTGSAINRSRYLDVERARIYQEFENKDRQRKIILLVVASSFIPLVVGFSFLYFHFRRNKTRRFPDIHPPRRLGAPHAGGNHATLDLGPPAS